MRILVTSKNGQLEKSINKLINTEAKVDNNLSSDKFIFIGRGEIDLSGKCNNH